MEATAYIGRLKSLLESTVVSQAQGLGKTMNLDAGCRAVCELIKDARERGGAVALVGNGGSAAVASHMQNDLACAVGVPAITFAEPSLLTANANDFGYAEAFERPLRLWGSRLSLLFAISSSGNSANIVAAARAGVELGLSVVTLSGFSPDNALRKVGHYNFYCPESDYGLVELAHSCLSHYFTDRAAGRVTAANLDVLGGEGA